ncbi:MAG TPA: hypothetical protein VM253_01835 [Candidatus Limnocylindrales bacterium]|nr:hypothetical protein [Candidatus Limnocylindrales bacterium]
MTESVPSADYAAPPTPAPTRPGTVTAAGIILIVLGAFTLLLGLLLLIGVGLFAGAAGAIPAEAEMPGIGGLMGAFAGAIFIFTLIVVGFGVLQLLSGIKVLGGRNWARITGIVVAALGALFALAGLGGEGGQVFSLALLVANGFVVWVLATTGRWFAQPVA